MENTAIILIGSSAVIGGILNSLLGWLRSDPPEPFNFRKAGASLIVNILGAVAIAIGFNYSGITNIWLACLGALMAGAGTVSAAKNSLEVLKMVVKK